MVARKDNEPSVNPNQEQAMIEEEAKVVDDQVIEQVEAEVNAMLDDLIRPVLTQTL